MIIPKPLKIGDTIGIIAPAGPLLRYELFEVEKKFNELGYEVKFSKGCVGSYREYLAASDDIRTRDIEEMFLDTSVDAIFCIRGGYGTTRILDKINYNIIRNNPKIFVGFSDITALLIAFNQFCNLVAFHGIMAGTVCEWDNITLSSLRGALSLGSEFINHEYFEENILILKEGICRGEITGGNLSIIVSTLGTPYEIDTKDKILFIEEINEPLYKIDRMINHLRLAKKLDDCAGIVFGDFNNCDKSADYECLIKLLKEDTDNLNIPTIFNLKSGHCMPMLTIPFGIECELNTYENSIRICK